MVLGRECVVTGACGMQVLTHIGVVASTRAISLALVPGLIFLAELIGSLESQNGWSLISAP